MKVDKKDLSSRLAKESLKLLKSSIKNNNLNTYRRSGSDFLSKVVETLVLEVLNSRPADAEELSDEELYKHVSGQYLTFKLMLQAGIADGFSMALRRFARKPVDYYCWIEPVEEKATNKIPC